MRRFATIVVLMCFFYSGKSQYTKLLDCDYDGMYPQGSLVSDGTFLYGVTSIAGSNGWGRVFKIKPDGTGYDSVLNFRVTNGRHPAGTLLFDGTYLYGTAYIGGTSDSGLVYKVKPDGSGYQKLVDFVGPNGSLPANSLAYDGTYLYGMTKRGGVNHQGTIFKVLTSGTGYTKMLDFDGLSNGSSPFGTFYYDGTYLYGMTRNGGSSNFGIIFKILPNGTNYTKLYDFTGAPDGKYPMGSLVSDGNFLYGMTYLGGSSDSGSVFSIKPDGSSYSKLFDFLGLANGSLPYENMYYDGTYLYGMTAYGGTNNLGTIFKVLPTGQGYSKMYDFSGMADGQWPNGGLISDGTYLYGMTGSGGAIGGGVIFKLTTITGIRETKLSSTNIYPNPANDKVIIVSRRKEDTTVHFTSAGGQVVLSNKLEGDGAISIKELPCGAYFVIIKNDQEVTVKKMMIAR